MASKAPDVRVRLSAEGVAEVVAAFKRVQSEAEKAKKASSGGLAGIKQLTGALGGLKTLIPAISVGAIVTGFVALAKNAISTASAIGKMNQKTGLSIDTLSVISFAAQKTGSDIEVLEKGFIKFGKAMNDLDNGSSGVKDSVAQLLGSSKALNGLDTDGRFRKVVDALSQMEPSYRRTALAQEFFGKGGAQLLPMMDKLGGQGFDKLREHAEKLGLVFDEKFVKAARQAKASGKELELMAKGMATQLTVGLVPALGDAGDALATAVSSDGVNGFRSLGEIAGSVVKQIVLSLTKIALAGVVVFGRVASVGQRAFQLLDNVAHMRFKGSWEQFKNDVVADADALDATVTAKLYKVELALAGAGRPKAEKDKKDKTRGQGTDQAAIEKARKATLALAEAEQDALARVAAAELKDQEAAEKERYEKGLESLHDYYANRIAMAEQQGKVEAAALYAKIVELQNTPLGKDELPAERQAQVTKAAADFQVKLLENAAAVNQLQGEQAKEAADLQQKALEFEKKIQKAQGDRFAAAKAEIEAQAAALDEILRKQGVGADERAQRVGAFRTSGFQQVDFDKLQNQASVALDAIEQKRRQIELAVQSGQLFSFQGEQQIVGMERERLPLLQQIADAMRAAAITDEQKASAAEFQAKLEQLAVSSNKAAQQMGEFKQNVEGAATSDLSNWLSSGIDQAENLGDAFRGLALSVVQSLRQIASQMLATYMIQKLLGFVMGAAAPASSPVGAGAQMPAGLSGGGIGMATGGLVRGPGTGTSDSIAARLSAGEYVIHAAAVRKIGVEALNALNFGNPTVRRRGGTRFAEGGLVDAGVGAGAGPQGLSATIGLDEGLLLKRLEASPAFHRLFVKVAGQNKKGMSQALR